MERIEWQGRCHEQLGGLGRHGDELARRNCRQFSTRLVLPQQVAANQPGIGLADQDKRLPGPVMDDGCHIDAAIGHTVTKNRKMNHRDCSSTYANHGATGNTETPQSLFWA